MGTRIPMNKQDVIEKDRLRKLELNTSEIGLSVRTTNCLEEQGIFTVENLLHCSREELLAISNFGEKTLEEVYLSLENLGFYRKSRQQQEMVCPNFFQL
jgi:DNA-directed RNA polymerase subunit alpha